MYIPLGGSHIYETDYKTTTRWGKLVLTPAKKAKLRIYLNIFTVWMLTGLWHGASMNFVAWGIYYGVLLIVEKQFLLKKLEKLPGFVRTLYTMAIVIVGWVFFASTNFASAFSYIGSMINIFNIGFGDSVFLFRLFSYWLVLLAAVVGCTPKTKQIFMKYTSGKLHWIRPLMAFVLLVVCVAYLVDDTYNPFLYFRF